MRQRPLPRIGYLHFGSPADPASWTTLLDALGRHTPTLEPDPPDGCWLDARAGRRGGATSASAASPALATARDWGYPTARLGIAPTPGVARLAAVHGLANPTVLDPHAVAAFLAPLAIDCLGFDGDTVARLRLVGLHTLGSIAALPRGALGDYLGAAGPALEALARGEDDRPLVPIRPPLVLTAGRDLDFALDDRAQLAALVERLLAPLLARLQQQGLGATRAALTLRTGAGDVAAAVPLAAPTVAAPAILGPLLAVLPAPAPDETAEDVGGGVIGVTVTLTAPRTLVGRQASFFDVPQGQRGRLALGVREARRRGDGHLGYLRLVDPAHPLSERRYILDEGTVPDGDQGGEP